MELIADLIQLKTVIHKSPLTSAHHMQYYTTENIIIKRLTLR